MIPFIIRHIVVLSIILMLFEPVWGKQQVADQDSSSIKKKTDALFFNPFGVQQNDSVSNLASYLKIPDSVDNHTIREASGTSASLDSIHQVEFDESQFLLYEHPKGDSYSVISATITQPQSVFRNDQLSIGANYQHIIDFFDEYRVDVNFSKSVIKVGHYKEDSMFEFYMRGNQVVKIRFKRPLGSVKE